LASVEELELVSGSLKAGDLEVLGAERAWARLRVLELRGNEKLRSVGLEVMAKALEAGGWPVLEWLGVEGCMVGAEGVRRLAEALEGGAPCAATLRGVNLMHNIVGSDMQGLAGRLLLACPRLTTLEFDCYDD
jgi:Ran GTPase-activating protein (RanGAP) involved in mRNA processing and transport